MITPIMTMTINELEERKCDVLMSADDIKEMNKNVKNKTIDEFLEQLKEYKYGRTNGVYIEIPLYKLNEIAKEMKAGGTICK